MTDYPIVNEANISNSLLGGYVAVHPCPHCKCELKSKEKEIGNSDTCPTCGGQFVVALEVLKRIGLLKSKKEAEKQKRITEKKQAQAEIREQREKERREIEAENQKREKRKQQEFARKKRLLEEIIVTTAPTVEGFRIVKHLGVDGVEIVTGTGLFSEVTSEITDFFGARSAAFESKLRKGRNHAIRLFKELAIDQGANAIIAIDFDYTEFGGNRTGIIITGTLVRIEPISEQGDSTLIFTNIEELEETDPFVESLEDHFLEQKCDASILPDEKISSQPSNTIEVTCPHCFNTLSLELREEVYAGEMITCPDCDQEFEVTF